MDLIDEGARLIIHPVAGKLDDLGYEGLDFDFREVHLLTYNQELTNRHAVAGNAPMGTEMIPVLALENFDRLLVFSHQRQQNVEIGITVRRVGKNQDALSESGEHPIKCLHRRPPVGEWRESLGDLLHAG
jgi:hypothetical protein